MTNEELRDAAWLELTKTTDPYPKWVQLGRPISSHWAKARALLDQIKDPVAKFFGRGAYGSGPYGQ